MRNKRYRARRQFLKRTAAAAIAGGGLAAMNGKLTLLNSALAASGDYANLTDYKALVCVFLYGGSDSFNMYMPMDQGTFDSYTEARGGLALEQSSLIADSSNTIGFNPNLGALRDLYDAGRLAVVGNVGNLIQPVTRAQIIAGTAELPVDLFAHDHQQEQVQKSHPSLPQSVVEAGWGGRMADMLIEANANSILPPTFSMFGTNDFQTGHNTLPISINPSSGPTLMGYMDPAVGGTNNHARAATMEKILQLQSNHPLQRFASNSFDRAQSSSALLKEALANSPDFSTPYNSGSHVSAQLRMVARLIAAHSELNMKRQIFFVGMGGWDTHDAQAQRLTTLTSELNAALASFQQTLDELPDLSNSVTTFTQTDFGRSLTNNDGGSNHGWGGHQIVMGGALNGGQMIGDWPDYSIGGPDDFNDTGRVIPKISVNQFGAAMGSWLGLSNSDLLDVFPDLNNFDTEWQSQYGLFNAS